MKKFALKDSPLCGCVCKVDILPGGYDGEFPENGTTNVDFNQPMISALSQVNKNEKYCCLLVKKR